MFLLLMLYGRSPKKISRQIPSWWCLTCKVVPQVLAHLVLSCRVVSRLVMPFPILVLPCLCLCFCLCLCLCLYLVLPDCLVLWLSCLVLWFSCDCLVIFLSYLVVVLWLSCNCLVVPCRVVSFLLLVLSCLVIVLSRLDFVQHFEARFILGL